MLYWLFSKWDLSNLDFYSKSCNICHLNFFPSLNSFVLQTSSEALITNLTSSDALVTNLVYNYLKLTSLGLVIL